MRSLGRLVQVQGDFEASVKDMLEGLDGLWAQLEELHTRVTLTKEGSRGLRDLASAQADAEVSRRRVSVCSAVGRVLSSQSLFGLQQQQMSSSFKFL